ncbi:alpha/beta fold hydrolase [Roseomonas genomospecies 6]|uniref:Alpha/beta hydrolase n=1 Tax=Roseomonas genomospecies 6 TaxID=214106 RepID=A0A9W7TY20_9PROT|nr:alpha/beta hydrolase [Roseomonas genomospecies 6]KAA0680448.1 alpha/beta hydrolase [Roseomonas genomospecies 6]
MTIHSSAGRPAGAAFGIAPSSVGEAAGEAATARGGSSWDGASRDVGRDIGRESGPGCIVAGDPTGRRIILVHASSGETRAWTRLLRAVPAGQEWVAVPRPDPGPMTGATRLRGGDPGVPAAALRPLLALRRARKPLLVGCGCGVPVVLRAALDFPELVGGLLLIDPMAEDGARPGMFRRIAARILPPVVRDRAAELRSMAPGLDAIRVPVTLVQGKDEPDGGPDSGGPDGGGPGASFLEQRLTGCRTLTVVTVPGQQVLPAKHESAIRGALAALVASVERGGA